MGQRRSIGNRHLSAFSRHLSLRRAPVEALAGVDRRGNAAAF
jgi:hypothetical protein